MNMHATDRSKMYELIPKQILIPENSSGCYFFCVRCLTFQIDLTHAIKNQYQKLAKIARIDLNKYFLF